MRTRSRVTLKRSKIVSVGIGAVAAAFAAALAVAQLQATATASAPETPLDLSPVEILARDVAIDTGALPTSLGANPAYCPTEDIAVTYQPIPGGSFQVGAYVEPLLPPGADSQLVTGIVYCTSSPLAVMGFDAVHTDQGWEIWPIPAGG